MPRMGAAKTGASVTTAQQETAKPTIAPGDDAPIYKPLQDHVRESAKAAVQEQVAHLARTQANIRGRDGKIKRAKFHAAVLSLRWEGFTPKETAEILGCSHGRVDAALLRLREASSMDEQIERIDQALVPLAVDNLATGILDGDRQYTLKLLEGRGVFRTHKSVEGTIKKTILHLKVVTEMPKHLGPDAIPMPVPGSIVGAPALLPAPGQEDD